jgi:glycosyltransferase involved in cell wall biosynthesis
MRCPALSELPPPPPGKTGWPWTEESEQLPETLPDGSPWPKISIVTPSYNHGEFIEETIRSVLLQGYPNLEYIIIDGASTDGSVEIIKKYEKWLAYWVSEPDEGHRYALKKGFDRATGEVVAWQNADDYYEPNVFGQVMQVFKGHPNIDVVYGNVRVVDDNSNALYDLRFVPASYWSTLFGHFPMHNQAAFFRKSLWDAAGGIGFRDYFFDRDLFIRIMRASQKQRFIHKILGNYRAHEASGTFGGLHLHLKENPLAVTRRYLGRWAGLPDWVLRLLFCITELRRVVYFICIGDWDYLACGALKRIGLRKYSACTPMRRKQ